MCWAKLKKKLKEKYRSHTCPSFTNSSSGTYYDRISTTIVLAAGRPIVLHAVYFIINTYNRCKDLEKLLESLYYLEYKNF